MKLNKITLLLATLGTIASAPAAAVAVGGIDFGALGADGNHFETATIAQQFINGDGQTTKAYGHISTVNGANNYCASGSCSLYYIASFENSTNFSATNVEFTSASIEVFFSDMAGINLLNQSSAANISFISGLDEWVRFTNHGSITGTGSFLGSVLAGNGAGLFDVDLNWGRADAAAFLDGNEIADGTGGFADLDLNSSFTNNISRLNRNDDLTGCTTGQAAAGQWCYGGSADISGQTVNEVPEPATLALLGLGLLGLSVMRRSKK